MSLTLVTAPASEPLTASEVKTHLRIDHSDEDTYIGTLITAARVYLEQTLLSTALITQTWDLTLDTWPATTLYVPRAPLQSITSVTYTDEDGNSDTVTSTDYVVDTASKPGRVVLATGATWPAVTLKELGGVVVRFVAGYGDNASDVPAPIKHALLLLIGDYYEYREQSFVAQGGRFETLPLSVKQLLLSYWMRDNRVTV